jgi:hypothetical protein
MLSFTNVSGEPEGLARTLARSPHSGQVTGSMRGPIMRHSGDVGPLSLCWVARSRSAISRSSDASPFSVAVLVSSLHQSETPHGRILGWTGQQAKAIRAPGCLNFAHAQFLRLAATCLVDKLEYAGLPPFDHLVPSVLKAALGFFPAGLSDVAERSLSSLFRERKAS